MTPPDLDWTSRLGPVLSPACLAAIRAKVSETGHMFADSFRAARRYKRTDVKRFKGCRTCCGSVEWTSEVNGQPVLLGYNHGH